MPFIKCLVLFVSVKFISVSLKNNMIRSVEKSECLDGLNFGKILYTFGRLMLVIKLFNLIDAF